ncbi:MAG: hypothetical protein SFY92_05550 [Verrucomicrobiae bacterium]|nr:hypothetical protein [Verrucomicrobiae bacterium]
MSIYALIFGTLLVLLGLGAFVATGMTHFTALIPSAFGALIGFCGLLAQKEHLRKHAMHGAATLALVGLLGSVPGVIKAVQWLSGTAPARPAAVLAQSVMALLCLVFLILCIRSFIAARKKMKQG